MELCAIFSISSKRKIIYSYSHGNRHDDNGANGNAHEDDDDNNVDGRENNEND